MNRRFFLKQMGAVAAGVWLGGCADALTSKRQQTDQTNFVVILTDDMGYADVGCFGGETSTPHIDRLAQEGMRFTHFYAQPACTPSRASLLTGCYPSRIGIGSGNISPSSDIGLNPEEEMITDILKKKGYVSGLFGKWHLGSKTEFYPLQQGIDEFFGLPYSNDYWPVDFCGTPITEDNPGQRRRALQWPQLPLIEGNEPVEHVLTLDDQDQLTTRITKRSIDFIETHRDRPFFLYVAHPMPHVPLAVSDKFRGKSKQGLYGDVVMEIDWSVGQIMAALKRNGLDDNTLVIFFSDNGPWLNYGNHAGSAGPLREGKGSTWEGGPRVPCIMRWPEQIKPGSEYSKPAASIDILPTFAEIAAAPLPKKKIDGISLVPLLEGRTDEYPDRCYYMHYLDELRGVVQGQWKLTFPHRYRSYEGVEPGDDGWPGQTIVRETGLKLFDLENDIGETTNVADQYPDVVKRLQELADIARRDIGDKLTGHIGQHIRPPGRAS